MSQPARPGIYDDIDGALRAGDMPGAIALARQALDAGLTHPALLELRAHWHESEGRLREACADLEQALAMAPDDPRLLLALGRCLTAVGRLHVAIAVLERAVAAAPGAAAAHYSLGFARELAGLLEPARQAYETAAALDPAMDDAVARLASLAARRNDPAQARILAERALARNPKNITAAFSHIVADLAQGAFDQAAARARTVLAEPALIPEARANAFSFAGDAADGLGRTEEAFTLYTAANDALAARFAPAFAGRETGRAFAARMAREFGALPDGPAPAPQGPAPVFLLGFPRAGTTLLAQILASHPKVVTLEEKPLLDGALREFEAQPGALARLAGLSAAERQHYRDGYWRAARAFGADPAARLVVDQTPLNTVHLAAIAALFPDAKIVFAMRDPRDVVFSCFRRLFAVNAHTFEFLSLEGAARFYDAAMALFTLYRERLALTLREVRNEDLVDDFEGQTRALCDFVGLAWHDAMGDFASAATSRAIATPSAMQVARGLNRDSVGHWRAYATQMTPVLPLLAPWVERFGYA